mmetsp:Transcript_20987/g.31653  ORF Transcript_20987/g.31653 Transcript_20987/m.31653 type:complete len:100 (-) Transcript_20987:305-604(-)
MVLRKRLISFNREQEKSFNLQSTIFFPHQIVASQRLRRTRLLHLVAGFSMKPDQHVVLTKPQDYAVFVKSITCNKGGQEKINGMGMIDMTTGGEITGSG